MFGPHPLSKGCFLFFFVLLLHLWLFLFCLLCFSVFFLFIFLLFLFVLFFFQSFFFLFLLFFELCFCLFPGNPLFIVVGSAAFFCGSLSQCQLVCLCCSFFWTVGLHQRHLSSRCFASPPLAFYQGFPLAFYQGFPLSNSLSNPPPNPNHPNPNHPMRTGPMRAGPNPRTATPNPCHPKRTSL